jgi:hypothetical protein
MKKLIGYFGLTVFLLMLLYALKVGNDLKKRVYCGGTLKGIYTALCVYHHDYDVLPEYDRWYDLLISETEHPPGSFRCPSVKKEEGKGNYFVNKNIPPSWKADGDLIFLFEGDSGWNQVGEKQDARFRHANGFNFIRANGAEGYITQKEIDRVRWSE